MGRGTFDKPELRMIDKRRSQEVRTKEMIHTKQPFEAMFFFLDEQCRDGTVSKEVTDAGT